MKNIQCLIFQFLDFLIDVKPLMKFYLKLVFFLRFYERRNKFRYQLRRKLKEKNEMKRELSACVVEKFNGFEILRKHLNSTEKHEFIPIDVVYEPTLNESKPIECFFAPEIF